MATLGNTSSGEFIDSTNTDGQVMANKYTASSSFTAKSVFISCSPVTSDQKLYFAVYDDVSGAPSTVLGTGDIYKGTAIGWIDCTISNVTITSGNDYWIACYAYKVSGNSNIQFDVNSASQSIETWSEGVEGSWTATPSNTLKKASREVSFYISSIVPTRIITDFSVVFETVYVTESTTVNPPLPINRIINNNDSLSISESVVGEVITHEPDHKINIAEYTGVRVF